MNRDIFRLAIPNIISNITVPLLGMVDMFVVGHLDSPDYIGAIALATILFNFIYWSFAFLRMGTSGFTAQAFGAHNRQEQTNILLRSLLVALVAGLLIVALQGVIAWLGFYLLNGSEMVKLHAHNYFFIYIWSAPAVLAMYALNGWFIGMQNARTPMYVAIGINVVNISLNFFFVYGMGMKIEGVAWASLIAQYVGLIASLIILNVKYSSWKKYIQLKALNTISSFIPFFKVNANIFIRTLALIAVTTFFMSTSSAFGDDVLSVNALLMQLFILFSYMMDGFAYAGEALTGRFVGAGDRNALQRLVKSLFICGGLLALLFTGLYFVFGDAILAILTDKVSILELSKEYQFWAMLIPLAGFAAFVWDGIFVGATASRQMRNSMLIAASAFFLVFYLLKDTYHNNALWLAFITYLALRGIVQTLMSKKVLKVI